MGPAYNGRVLAQRDLSHLDRVIEDWNLTLHPNLNLAVAYDKCPILATDRWLFGNPYFVSWKLSEWRTSSAVYSVKFFLSFSVAYYLAGQ